MRSLSHSFVTPPFDCATNAHAKCHCVQWKEHSIIHLCTQDPDKCWQCQQNDILSFIFVETEKWLDNNPLLIRQAHVCGVWWAHVNKRTNNKCKCRHAGAVFVFVCTHGAKSFSTIQENVMLCRRHSCSCLFLICFSSSFHIRRPPPPPTHTKIYRPTNRIDSKRVVSRFTRNMVSFSATAEKKWKKKSLRLCVFCTYNTLYSGRVPHLYRVAGWLVCVCVHVCAAGGQNIEILTAFRTHSSAQLSTHTHTPGKRLLLLCKWFCGGCAQIQERKLNKLCLFCEANRAHILAIAIASLATMLLGCRDSLPAAHWLRHFINTLSTDATNATANIQNHSTTLPYAIPEIEKCFKRTGRVGPSSWGVAFMRNKKWNKIKCLIVAKRHRRLVTHENSSASAFEIIITVITIMRPLTLPYLSIYRALFSLGRNCRQQRWDKKRRNKKKKKKERK